MTTLPILLYPDVRLKTVAEPVTVFDDQLQRLVNGMIATMREARGIGLAATQVNVHQRITVIDVSPSHDEVMVLINPEVVERSTAMHVHEEGCLSIPGVYDKVERPAQVTVQAHGVQGQPFTFEATGLLAVCVQHEIDHLNGKLFIDGLSALKRSRAAEKVRKTVRERK